MTWRAKEGLATLISVSLLLMPMQAHAFSFSDLWPFGEKKADKQPVQDPTPYEVRIDSDDPSLQKMLVEASLLNEKKAEVPSGIAGLLSRAKNDRDTLTAFLYEKARYGAQIIITINDKPIDTLNAFSKIGTLPASVHVRVMAGREFSFGRLQAPETPKPIDLNEIGFVSGKPASSKVIIATEAKMLATWREAGYPLATLGERRVEADHKTGRVDVSLTIKSGRRAPLGNITTAGEQTVHSALIINRSGLKEGMDYKPETLKDAETKVRALGMFDGVRITTAETLDAQGRIPVLITVTEKKLRTIGAGISYSNTEGAAVEAYWMHRNLFGGAESLRVGATISRLGVSKTDGPDYRVTARFRKPAVITADTDFTTGLVAERETTLAYRKDAAGFDIGFEHQFSKYLSGSLAYELERSRITTPKGVNDYWLTGLNGTLGWDSRDNKLDPTEGFRVMARIRPTYDLTHKEFFASMRLDASAYYALDDKRRYVLAGRVAFASVTAKDINMVPVDRRLFAGGGGSIRGFGYQALGPRDATGALTGGRSLFEASAELRVKATDSLGFAVFADAGNAYSTVMPQFGDLKMSVGAGIRYLTPIGPFRLDVALPVKRDQYDPKFGIYLGLGQAF